MRPKPAKELAYEFGCSVSYISLMRRAGFVMVAGLATAEQVRSWHTENLWFSCHRARRDFPPRRTVKTVKSDASSA